jgi:mannose-6-phosphate isomerase-like protein (cupin superfamily)
MRQEQGRGRRRASFAVLAVVCVVGAFASSRIVASAGGAAGTKTKPAPRGFVQNIETLASKNEDFRHVLYTGAHSQLVLMTLKPGEEIGKETHKAVDQFFRVEQGTGEVELAGVRTPIGPGFAVVVPAGLRHNIVNTGKEPLRLYTIYSPPNHHDGVVHHARSEAEHDSEHFDGETTE